MKLILAGRANCLFMWTNVDEPYCDVTKNFGVGAQDWLAGEEQRVVSVDSDLALPDGHCGPQRLWIHLLRVVMRIG